jgi:hypothetical protein
MDFEEFNCPFMAHLDVLLLFTFEAYYFECSIFAFGQLLIANLYSFYFIFVWICFFGVQFFPFQMNVLFTFFLSL